MISFYHGLPQNLRAAHKLFASAVCGLKRDGIAINATSVACFRKLCVDRQCKKQLQHRHNFRCVRNVELIKKCFWAMQRYLINYLQKIAKIDP
jgi:hypothetical protein